MHRHDLPARPSRIPLLFLAFVTCFVPLNRPGHTRHTCADSPARDGISAVSHTQVYASFSHSLLRVVPYDDYPSLPYSDEDPPAATTALTTTAATSAPGGWPASSFLPVSSSLSSSLSSPFPPGGGTGDGGVPFSGVPVDAGAIRGGDVVRLCHLTSTGFLTSAAVASGLCGGGERRRQDWRDGRSEGELETEAGVATTERGRGGSGPFLYISATPRRRQNLQNASSNSLWVLERTHCALGGRPLRGSCSAAAAALEPQRSERGKPTAWLTSSAKVRGANSGSAVHPNRYAAPSSGSLSFAGGAPTSVAAAGSSAYSSGGDSGGGGSAAERRRQQSDAYFAAGNVGEGRGGGGGAGIASNTHTSSFFAIGGGGGGDVGRDTYAEAVAKRRRRQGAGDAVEYVRIKHLATMRYLCVGKKCDPVVGDGVPAGAPRTRAGGTASTRRRGDSRKRGAAAASAAATRVGMLTVERHAAVPAATVFVIRPRTTAAASTAGAGAGTVSADRWLGPEDLVHLQHKDTGLFLSALPLDQEVAGSTVGLTMVKSPLTTEVGASVLGRCVLSFAVFVG